MSAASVKQQRIVRGGTPEKKGPDKARSNASVSMISSIDGAGYVADLANFSPSKTSSTSESSAEEQDDEGAEVTLVGQMTEEPVGGQDKVRSIAF